jgi:hypothetical protein
MNGFLRGVIYGAFTTAVFGAISTSHFVITQEDLLRFCMTHSIALEQCKIPEEKR